MSPFVATLWWAVLSIHTHLRPHAGAAVKTHGPRPNSGQKPGTFQCVPCKVWLGSHYIEPTSGVHRHRCTVLSTILRLCTTAAEEAGTELPLRRQLTRFLSSQAPKRLRPDGTGHAELHEAVLAKYNLEPGSFKAWAP